MEELTLTHTLAVLEKYGRAVSDLYKEELRNMGKKASGGLINSVEYEVVTEKYSTSVVLHLADYWKYVERGRRPGKFPPPDAIRKWIEVKPILPRPFKNGKLPTTEQLTFLIGRKIKEKGIEPSPALELSVETVNKVYMPMLEEAFALDVGEMADKLLVTTFRGL